MFEKSTSVSLSSFEIERQARQERSFARSACVRGAGHALARGLRLLRSRGIRLLRDLVTQRLLRRVISELYKLDDRTLADIGVTRGEIVSAVRHGLHTRKLEQQNWHVFTACFLDICSSRVHDPMGRDTQQMGSP